MTPSRVVILAAACAALGAAPALAQDGRPKRLPDGAAIAGVPVGGLGPIGAERAVRAAVGPVYGATIIVTAAGRERRLDPADAGFSVDYDAMVERAFELAARGRAIRVELDASVDGGRLTRATRAVAPRFRRSARNARVRFGIRRVVRIRHRSGRRLDTARLRRDLLAELRAPSEGRRVRGRLLHVRPKVTTSRLGRIHHTFVSIDRRTFTLRLFKRLRVVRTYRVAVGAGGYDTPRGLHRVLSRQVDPAWHAPNRPWAGSFAGQTIPSGDPRNPLKARWLGLGGGVGIHGTAAEGSIGSRASHGCIRMRVRDVKRLYPHVPMGTPVLIR
ncbi:MAG: L,D-transpeptidase family protein [Thermoleophilaceae bacterium]